MGVEGHEDEHLLCQEDCLWNVDDAPGERSSVDDSEHPGERGKGLAICNYEKRAPVLGLPVPGHCPHKAEIHGSIQPKAMSTARQRPETVDEFIKRKTKEARTRLGLGVVDVGR